MNSDKEVIVAKDKKKDQAKVATKPVLGAAKRAKALTGEDKLRAVMHLKEADLDTVCREAAIEIKALRAR